MVDQPTQAVLIEAFDFEIEEISTQPLQWATPSAPERRDRNTVAYVEAEEELMEEADCRSSSPEPQEARELQPSRGKRTSLSPGARCPDAKRQRQCLNPVGEQKKATRKSTSASVDHTYRDLSHILPDPSDGSKSDESFPMKMHEILSSASFRKYISWMPHGRAFRVNVPKKLEEKVLPKFFGHGRYSTFLHQLSSCGFKHITQGRDRNCFYHEAFLRGLPHLCKMMPPPKARRRLIPDPKNEPDFYRCPLPDAGNSSGSGMSQARVSPEQAASESKMPPNTNAATQQGDEIEARRQRLFGHLQAASMVFANTQMMLSQGAACQQTQVPQPCFLSVMGGISALLAAVAACRGQMHHVAGMPVDNIKVKLLPSWLAQVQQRQQPI